MHVSVFKSFVGDHTALYLIFKWNTKNRSIVNSAMVE